MIYTLSNNFTFGNYLFYWNKVISCTGIIIVRFEIYCNSLAHLDLVSASFASLPMLGANLGHWLLAGHTCFIHGKWLFLATMPTDHSGGQEHFMVSFLLLVADITWVTLTTARKPEIDMIKVILFQFYDDVILQRWNKLVVFFSS